MVHTVRYTGENYFTNSHNSGSGLYFRSTAAADVQDVNVYGKTTSGSNAAKVTFSPSSGQGKIEQLSATAWSDVYLLKADSALAGIGSLFSNNGTAATGTIHICSQPYDGETLEIGLTGFTKTFTFRNTVSANGDVKSVTSVSEVAANLASAINDTATGSHSTGGESSGGAWTNTDGANPYVTATVSGATVTLTDKINANRQLGWVTTASSTDRIMVSGIRGGIDGTKIVDIPATGISASFDSTTGVNLDSEDLSTTNVSGAILGGSDSMAVRGRFIVDIRTEDPGAAVLAKIQTSNDNINWRDASSTITDLNSDQDQIINGNDLFAEYARLNFTSWSSTAAKSFNIKFISQG